MSWLRFGVYSAGSLTTAILLLAITAYLFSLPNKTPDTLYLAGYIGFLFMMLLAYVIRYSVFHPTGAHSGQVANLIVFAVVCLIQFSYHYGGLDHRLEARIVLVTSLVIGGRVWFSNFFRGLPTVYDFEAQYFTFEHGPRVSIFVLIGFLWAFSVLLRKTVLRSRRTSSSPERSVADHLLHPAGRWARSAKSFAILTAATTVLSLMYMLFQAGLISRATWSLFFNTGSLIIALLIAVVYLNNSSQPTGYQAKVIGIPLATVLVTFGIAASWMMPSLNTTLAERYVGEVESIRRLIAGGATASMPEGVVYVVRLDTKSVVYQTQEITERDISQLVTAEGEKGPLPASHGLQALHIKLRVNDTRTYSFFYPVDVDGVRYRVGFRYADYRLAIHRFGWGIAMTTLGATAFIMFVFPLVYRRGLLRPIENLLSAVRAVEGGDYHTEIPVFSQDELGRLARAFNSMVAAIRSAEETLQSQQEQLMTADKLASIGVLVASMAHEVNNPNQVIRMNGQFLAEALPVVTEAIQDLSSDVRIAGLAPGEYGAAACSALQEISQASERIHRIVRDLKEFAGDGSSDNRAPIEVNEVIESVSRLARHFVRRATDHFRLELTPDLPPIMGDRVRLEQVVLNLLQNAAAALPSRDRSLWITTALGQDGVAVRLEVGDEGDGIRPGDLERITDPFFTTRRSSGGTGLGLSISDRIVRDHGGTLVFESTPYHGTRAIVTLPI